MLSIDDLTVEFGGFRLLDRISFVINRNERVALTGKNGAGKSTLLKIMAGIKQPTNGIVSVPKDIKIGYLPQQLVPMEGRTVRQEASLAFADLQKMEKELQQLHQDMVSRDDFESDAYHSLIQRTTDLHELLQISGIHNFEAEVEKTLTGLGFLRSDFDRPTNQFSGGWQMRIELAKILLQSPDLLLLDEPTNHLDIESIEWLENFLITNAAAVMLVSHDRTFLDTITNRTIEIVRGSIDDYKVSYSQYVELRKIRIEQQSRAYENQQKQIRDSQEFIDRFRYKPTKSNQVQSRIKQLKKLELIEIDEVDNSKLNLKFPPAPRSGSYPLIVDNLSKSWDSNLVLKDINLTLKRGEKVAFVGKNGEGKSTLIKCIINETKYEGSLKLGHNVQIGYFAQNQAALLNEELTVLETIDQVAVGDIRTKIRDILGAFMFGGESSDKKVKVLSGGERSRLAMIRLLLEPVNLLILDEPTNHLDMASKNVLKKAISEFGGTAIIVSHDRDFLDGLISKVYEFSDKNIRQHIGGIFDFLSNKRAADLKQLNLPSDSSSISRTDDDSKSVIESEDQKEDDNMATKSKKIYLRQKELSRQRRKLEREIEAIENKIDPLETEIRVIENKLATPEGAANRDKIENYIKVKAELEQSIIIWEKLSLDLENLLNKS